LAVDKFHRRRMVVFSMSRNWMPRRWILSTSTWYPQGGYCEPRIRYL